MTLKVHVSGVDPAKPGGTFSTSNVTTAVDLMSKAVRSTSATAAEAAKAMQNFAEAARKIPPVQSAVPSPLHDDLIDAIKYSWAASHSLPSWRPPVVMGSAGADGPLSPKPQSPVNSTRRITLEE